MIEALIEAGMIDNSTLHIENIEREFLFKHNGRKYKVVLSAPRSEKSSGIWNKNPTCFLSKWPLDKIAGMCYNGPALYVRAGRNFNYTTPQQFCQEIFRTNFNHYFSRILCILTIAIW